MTLREPLNGLTHFLGIILGIVGIVLLLIKNENTAISYFSYAIFGGTMILLYFFSTLYHWLNISTNKVKILRKIDHIMIFIFIAGTYTPICLLGLKKAWYGHLKFKELNWNLGLTTIILISWGIALFEYILQVPANKIGFLENGGPFSLWQLKVIQEVSTLVVFTIFSLVLFKSEPLKLNHLIGFAFLVLAVFFIFKK